jgi:hypothetical protein
MAQPLVVVVGNHRVAGEEEAEVGADAAPVWTAVVVVVLAGAVLAGALWLLRHVQTF